MLAVPGAHAYAKIHHNPDDGVRCTYFNNKTGQWLFYMPGEKIVILDENGHPTYLVCGVDGNWTVVKTDPATSDHGGATTTHQGP